MVRLCAMAGSGTAVGFVAFIAMFIMATRPDNSERPLWAVFSVMGAISMAVFATLFGAVMIIRKDLEEIRRELLRLRRIEQFLDAQAMPAPPENPGTSTGISNPNGGGTS